MSYILDALKKSDQERKRKEPPGLQTVHRSYSAPPEQKKAGPLLKWLPLVTVLLLLTVSGIIWLKKENPAENISEKSSKKPLVQQADIRPAVENRNRPNLHIVEQQVPITQPEPTSPAQNQEQLIAEISNEESENNILPVGKKKDMTQAPSALPDRTPENDQASNLQATRASSPDQEPTEHAEVSTKKNALPDTPSADQQGTETAPAVEIDREVVYFRELPVAVQKKMPEIKMEGHVYAEEPSLRMIIINNRIVREGDQVQGSLYLKEITWEGVVLRYDTTLFRLDMF